MVRLKRGIVLTLSLLVAAPALAGEPDDFYPWRRPVRDSTEGINALTNDEFQRQLRTVNRRGDWRELRCREVSRILVFPMTLVEYRYAHRARKEFNVELAPTTNTELIEYRKNGLYRYVPLTTKMGIREPLLWLMGVNPVFPNMKVGGIDFSLDKLAHFFPTGWRMHDMLHREIRAGKTREQAIEAVLQWSVETELGIWGLDWNVFSYADLEANWQGLRYFEALCDGTPETGPPLLEKTSKGWRLREPFDLAPWVNPCWDESFYNSTYTPEVWPGIRRAIEESYCPLLPRPEIQARRAAYRRRGCDSYSHAWLEEKIRREEIPDPRPFSIEAVCEALDNKAQSSTAR